MASKKVHGRAACLRLDQLVILPELQMRAGGLNSDHADDLAADIKAGKTLPRVQVRVVEGRGNLVTDGFHTYEGHLRAKRPAVPVSVRHGTWEDAVLDAALANQQHKGLKRSAADKRRAVEMVLGIYPRWSGPKIASLVGVSKTFVNEIKASWPNCETGHSATAADSRPETIEAADGKVYPRDRNKKKAKAEPVGVDTEGWRGLPLDEFLKAEPFVFDELAAKEIETAGQLSDALGDGTSWNLPDHILKDLQTEVSGLENFKAPPKPKPAKVGAETGFPWREFDSNLGAVARAPDQLCGAYPTDHHPEYDGAIRLLTEFGKLWKSWRERIQKREAK